MQYELANPRIGSNTIITTVTASTPENAAKELWGRISKNDVIVELVPQFLFTLIDGNENLHHFKLNEKKNKDGSVDFLIFDITNASKMDADTEKKFIEEHKKWKQTSLKSKKSKKSKKTKGGSKNRLNLNKLTLGSDSDDLSDSSSSSDSSDDDYLYDNENYYDDTKDDYFNYIKSKSRSRKSPLWYWWYAPSIYRNQTIFTPVFNRSLKPYIELWVPIPN